MPASAGLSASVNRRPVQRDALRNRSRQRGFGPQRQQAPRRFGALGCITPAHGAATRDDDLEHCPRWRQRQRRRDLGTQLRHRAEAESQARASRARVAPGAPREIARPPRARRCSRTIRRRSAARDRPPAGFRRARRRSSCRAPRSRGHSECAQQAARLRAGFRKLPLGYRVRDDAGARAQLDEVVAKCQGADQDVEIRIPVGA